MVPAAFARGHIRDRRQGSKAGQPKIRLSALCNKGSEQERRYPRLAIEKAIWSTTVSCHARPGSNKSAMLRHGWISLNLIAQHTKMTREILTTSMSPDASRTKHRSFVCVARPHRTRRGSVLSLVTIALMDEEFDATKFIDQFHQGLFDGRVHEELAKLTQDQISEVALLLAARIKGRMDVSS